MSKQQDTEDTAQKRFADQNNPATRQQYFADQQNTEDTIKELLGSRYDKFAYLLKAELDQQKAEAADQAVREFAAELLEHKFTDSWNLEAVYTKQIQDSLEQFLGKGKDK